jgi:hypothetical protein
VDASAVRIGRQTTSIFSQAAIHQRAVLRG